LVYLTLNFYETFDWLDESYLTVWSRYCEIFESIVNLLVFICTDLEIFFINLVIVGRLLLSSYDHWYSDEFWKAYSFTVVDWCICIGNLTLHFSECSMIILWNEFHILYSVIIKFGWVLIYDGIWLYVDTIINKRLIVTYMIVVT